MVMDYHSEPISKKNKSRRVRRREHGCRIGEMQFETFATDSVGYKVMARLLAKITAKGDVKI